MNPLDRLAKLHGTDKSSDCHNYTHVYQGFLGSLRERPLTVLELGFGGHEDPDLGGASAKMWRDYFRHGTVVVVDIEDKHLTRAHDGINFRRGSQSDEAFIAALGEEFGPFDVIIDDASHLSSLTIKSFELLWPMLNPGGIYAVEDTHMAYHEQWYGKKEANFDPDGKTSTGNETAMQFLRRLADEVNFKGRENSAEDLDLYPRKFWRGYDVESVHFYFNLCVAVKR